MKHLFLATFLATIYFIAAFSTLSHYGISWDETIHFYRGQAYIQYFLTGKTTYDNLPQTNLQGTNGDPDKVTIPRRSFYQSDLYNGEYFLKNDSGHPPLNGELAALSNFIFYQKLGILGDVQSHHLFNILASTLLVFVVAYFAAEYFGIYVAIISFLALVTYPLFFAESHFNIKDPPQTAFFTAAIWAFVNSLKKGSIFWLVLFYLFLGLALGTKLNALFLPLVLLFYLALRYRDYFFKPGKVFNSIPKKYLTVLVIGPIIPFLIFFISWPYLWQDPVSNTLNIFRYYKEIGTGAHYQPENFFLGGFNTFPWQWILFTTPPLTLILLFLGLVSVWIQRGKKLIGLLLIFWFLMPIMRVSLSSSTIYGGIRQIMEFLPAMVLLAGLGVWQIVEWCKGIKYFEKRIIFLQTLLIVAFIWPILVIVKLHPNENIYFNFLTGGLPGASARNFPSWGNTFGNAYFQGIKWINENAEGGSKLSLIQGTSPNAPVIFLRKDIDFKSGNWSGIERGGEYLMELTFNDSARSFNYAWDYVENFLDPVYELNVEGVPILKIWKNDLEHTKPAAKKNEVEFLGSIQVKKEGRIIVLDMGKIASISRVYLYFDQLTDCQMPKATLVELSRDQSVWFTEKDIIPFRQVKQEENITDGKIEYFIAGKEARYVKFVFENTNACPLNYKSFKVLVLE